MWQGRKRNADSVEGKRQILTQGVSGYFAMNYFDEKSFHRNSTEIWFAPKF
jgi:hypothetical protein